MIVCFCIFNYYLKLHTFVRGNTSAEPSLYTSPWLPGTPWIGNSVTENDDSYTFIFLHNNVHKIKYIYIYIIMIILDNAHI